MTLIFTIWCIGESLFLEEAEWVLVFKNVNDKFLTILKVGEEHTSVNHALTGEERAAEVKLLVNHWLFDDVALYDFTI